MMDQNILTLLKKGSVFTTRKTTGSSVIRNKVTGKLRMRRYDKRNEIKRCQTKLKGTKIKIIILQSCACADMMKGTKLKGVKRN